MKNVDKMLGVVSSKYNNKLLSQQTHHNTTNLNYTGVTLTYDYERGKLEYTKGIPYYCKMKHTTSNLLLLDYTGVTLLMNVATWQSGENIWKWNTVQCTVHKKELP